MSKPLSELRTATPARAERTRRLCLNQSLVAEVEALAAEKADLAVESRRTSDDDDDRPRKMSQGKSPRIAEIDARLEVLYDEMRDHTGEIRLRAKTPGEWMLWSSQHPAREDNKIDNDVTYGYVNADDLVNDLESYALEWDGSPLTADEWDFIASSITPGDLKELARTVVQMHEGVGAVPKSRTSSSDDQPSATD